MYSLLRQRVSLLLLALFVTACAGADGPIGPTGPAGPAGPIGPTGPSGGANRTNYLVQIATDGYAEQGLPLSYGTDRTRPPLLSCYIAEVPSVGTWQTVGDGFTGTNRTVCALIFDEGRWFAVLINGPPGWTVAFTLIGS